MVQPQETHRPPRRMVMESNVSVTGATYAARAGDRLIGVNRAGAVTVTLPTAQLRAGRTYTIKDESGAAATNNITVATEGSETIDGSATDILSEDYGSKAYYSDGSNWFTVPLLAAVSHTLASHSSKAHSDLTGVGTDDHHTQAHQAAHNSAGADALKLDDLSAPDDNTDLNFSTTAHGLVPKGPNDGTFLKADGTWAAPGGGGALTREGGQTTEATTTSTSAVDLLTAASLSIATNIPIWFVVAFRKTTGAADDVAIGLKLNTTVTGEASTGGATPLGKTGTGNAAAARYASVMLSPRITNYLRGAIGLAHGTEDTSVAVGTAPTVTADQPSATITDLIIRGITDNASNTLGADELHVNSLAVS